MQISNPCIRCGLERIIGKVWTENEGLSPITYTFWICPDAECQAIVNISIKEKKDKAVAFQHDIEQRALERKSNREKKLHKSQTNSSSGGK